MTTASLDVGVRMPAVVRDVELSNPLPELPAVLADGRRPLQAWLLVRLFSEPLGVLELPLPQSAAQLADAIQRAFGPAIAARTGNGRADGGRTDGGRTDGGRTDGGRTDGGRTDGGRTDDGRGGGAEVGAAEQLTAAGVAVDGESAFLRARAAVLADAPTVTVVVCTRERPEQLRGCLDSLLAQAYPNFRVLVVDNAPATAATRDVVTEYAATGVVEYTCEPRPGLSYARNHALEACREGLVAWIDDDETADEHWLAEIAGGFAAHPEAVALAGLVVPAELDTPVKAWFEQFGGHSKGRGTTPAVFSPATAAQQNPLYPLPPFGTGANMAFRAEGLHRVGGFDTALGAGSPALGSEDTQIFTLLLRAGGTTLYRPSAITRHYHRDTLADLERQMYGYGCGLTAYYTSLVLADPRVLFALLRLAPTALRDLSSSSSLRVATLEDDFPRHLLGRNRRGMLAGPLAYLRGRRRDRRLRRRGSGQ